MKFSRYHRGTRKFIAKFRSGSQRIRNFHLRIEFSNLVAIANVPAPKIRRLRSEYVKGKIFTEEHTNTLPGGLDLPLGPSGGTLSVGDEVASTIKSEFQLRLTGWLTSSGSGSDNVLVWDCEEARKAARGVVPNYRGACIIRYNPGQPFVAALTIDAERGIFDSAKGFFEYLNVFAKKETDDPVVFNPDNPMDHQYDNIADFNSLDLEKIVKLEPFATLPPGYS